jgi:putative SOS response-associated peptidase YedK
MCGRYITPAEGDIERHWDLAPNDAYRQNFNTAPSQLAPVIRLGANGKAELYSFHWGFQPAWARRAWINARSETAFDSKAFAAAARKRRCLVPAIGWYEWQGSKAPKQPWCFHLDGFTPFAFAGIWTARDTVAGPDMNFAILTHAASPDLAAIHNRMPVIVHPDDYAAWLSPETEMPAKLIGPPAGGVQTYNVSTFVNKPQNTGPECLVPVA